MSTWRLDGFSEIGELGSGAQGRVVLARRGESGPFVAIKYVFDTGRGDTRVPSQREARILSSVDDQHVARLHELVEGPSGVAIVMEAVEGVSLDKLLREYGALEPEAALLVLKGSLLGLGAAHAAGVVHRDYKPANVVVQADGVSKLIDFGIATPAGERSLTGTPAYMAPEQWSGEPATPATDVYAATCVFFECVTGRPPYAGDNQMALMVQHTTAAPPVGQVPEPLRGLVAHGMAKQAVLRPSGAAEFLVELEAAAVEAYGEDWERRGLILLGAGAAALAALFPQAAATSAAGTTIGSTLGESVMGTVGTISREAVRLGRPRLLASLAVAAVAVVAIAAVALVLTKQSRPIALTRPPAPSASANAPAPAPTETASPAGSPAPTETVTPTGPSPSPSPSVTQPSPSPSDVVPAENPTTGPPATNGNTPPVVKACPRLTPPAGSFGSLQVKQKATESFAFPWNPCYSAAGITLRGDPAFSRQLTACPPASGTGACRIQVTFAPTSSGTHQATLVIPDKTGADAVTIDLTGVAESTDCFPYTSAQSFGEVPVKSTKQLNFTYPWRSCDAVDQMRVVDESGQFKAALTDCPPPAGTDQCSFAVSFTPASAGQHTATIVIPSDTGGQAVRITLTGTGTEANTESNTEAATEVTPSPAVTKPVLGVSEPPSSDPQPSTGPSTSGPVPQPSTPKPVPSTSKPDPEPAGSKPDPEPSTTKPDPEVSTPPGSGAGAEPQSKEAPTAP